MPIDLGRRLIAAGVVAPEEVEAALFLSVVRGVPFARVLIDRGVISERELDDELERLGGLALRHVVPAADLVARLPRAMCRRLAALPTRLDPMTGVVDVAAADPLDPHVAAEFGFQFGAPIRVLRAPVGAIEEAIRQLELGAEQKDRSRPRRATPPFPHGAPQSTIPPPPTDETPIPLVRRIEVEPETREMSTRRRGAEDDGAASVPNRPLIVPDDEEQTDVVLPLRNAKVYGAGDASSRAASRVPGVSAPSGFRTGPSIRAAATARSPIAGVEQPSISFPSQPPLPDAAGAGESTDTQARDGAWFAPSAGWNDDARGGGGNGAPTREEGFGYGEAPMSAAPALVEIAAPRLPRDLLAPPPSDFPAADEQQEAQTTPRRTARPPLMADMHRPRGEQATLTSAVMGDAIVAPMRVIAPSPTQAEDVRGGRRGTLPPPFGSPDGDDTARLMRAVRDAPSRDELVRLTLRCLRKVARRVALFAVRKDGYQGWACNVEFGDQDALKQLHVPAEVPSILATATATAFYLGPVPSTPGHAGLLSLMGKASPDVACLAVRVAGRAAMILLADDLDDTMLGTRFMDELARSAADGLSRLLGR